MSQNALPTYVVAASVAIKWYLNDEEHVSEAEELLTAFGQGRALLVAPDHIRYEVANAIRTAVRSGRVSDQQGHTAIMEFLSWQLPTVSDNDLILAGYDAAMRFGCALYDGLYLALVEITQHPLVHADRRLRNTLGGRFPLEVWIEDYAQR